MKRLLLLAAIAISFSARAQVVPVLTTTITKGYGNFKVDGKTLPLNSMMLFFDTRDTATVGLVAVNHCLQFSNDIIAPAKKRVKYINGTTGLPFTSVTAMKAYCDTFCYSH